MRKRNKLVCGVGINDADYVAQQTINGAKVICHFYASWKRMLERCYSLTFQLKNPTYEGCIVCDEWLTFSNFKRWMEVQDWEGKELDKDLLINGNKLYSPETCVFVSSVVNGFISGGVNRRGDCPIGVTFRKARGKLYARCRNPFTGKEDHIGYFDCEDKAHLAWKRRKHQLACQLADRQSDIRVAEALRARYA